VKSFFISTATKNSVIAILDDFKVIDSIEIESDKKLSDCLFVHIKNLFETNNILPEEIKKIFVSVGPGSFTGVRIGLTIAKTWASMLDVSLYPISSLEIIASGNSTTQYTCSLIDARRNYVYAGIYDDHLNFVIKDSYISLEEIYNEAKKLSASIYTYDSFDFETIIDQKVNIVKIIKKHWEDTPANADTLIPLYLKLTEAEERLHNA